MKVIRGILSAYHLASQSRMIPTYQLDAFDPRVYLIFSATATVTVRLLVLAEPFARGRKRFIVGPSFAISQILPS